MPRQNSDDSSEDIRRQQALSRWDNEGGAADPTVTPVADKKQIPTPEMSNADLVALHVRVIALENLLISQAAAQGIAMTEPRATPAREDDSALLRVLEAHIETLKAENEILTRRLAAAETLAAQETAKADGAIAELSAITRLRAQAAALGDGGSRDRRGSAEGPASTRLGYVR